MTGTEATPISMLQWPSSQSTTLLIVGGGAAALAYVQSLQPGSFNSITIVARSFNSDLRNWSQLFSNVALLERAFEPRDLQHCNLVVAATSDAAFNATIGEQAASLAIPTQVAAVSHQASSQFEKTALLRKIGMDDSGDRKWKRIATYLVAAFMLMITGHLIITALPLPAVQDIIHTAKPYFNDQFLFFVLAGFLAQLVDGALSMGYGVTSATCLMSFGVSPVAVSAAIHTSEIVTTGISGYSHYRFGNVNKKLFKHLLIPGVLGAITGALLLVLLGEKAGKWLMPLIAMYAMFLGVKILLKALQVKRVAPKAKRIGWLAGAGGFFDSFGGGGWGPIVTSTLVARGRDPRFTIGTVCLTEFFVTLASATTFFLTVGVTHWNIVLGLIAGGSIAAPFAARLAGKLPRKTMMIAVGVMVIIWCIRLLLKSIGVF